jgi:hypothetical protein
MRDGLEPGSSAGGSKWDHFTPSAASLCPNSAATPTPGRNGSGSDAQAETEGGQVAVAHNAPPAAAIAAPLSVTVTITQIHPSRWRARATSPQAARREKGRAWPWNKDGRSPGLAALDLGIGRWQQDVERLPLGQSKAFFACALLCGLWLIVLMMCAMIAFQDKRQNPCILLMHLRMLAVEHVGQNAVR